jgi:hypothetical protein
VFGPGSKVVLESGALNPVVYGAAPFSGGLASSPKATLAYLLGNEVVIRELPAGTVLAHWAP